MIFSFSYFHFDDEKMLQLLGSILLGVFVALLVQSIRGNIEQLQRKERDGSVTLKVSPNRLSRNASIALNLALVGKHLPLNGAPKLQPAGKQEFKLPYLVVNGKLDIDDSDRAKFVKAVTLGKIQQDEAWKDDRINFMFLAAMTSPLLIVLLSQPTSPIKPLGAVNTRNVLRVYDSDQCTRFNSLQKLSNEGKLTFSASIGGEKQPGIRKKRGMETNVNVVIRAKEKVILEMDFFFLQFLSKNVEPRFDPSSSEEKRNEEREEEDGASSIVSLPHFTKGYPFLWSSCSGDYNPIHISPLAAKLFGFSSSIAHGNHIVALAMQEMNTKKGASFILRVQFVKPMLLPIDLDIASRKEGKRFNVVSEKSSEKVYIIGSIE